MNNDFNNGTNGFNGQQGYDPNQQSMMNNQYNQQNQYTQQQMMNNQYNQLNNQYSNPSMSQPIVQTAAKFSLKKIIPVLIIAFIIVAVVVFFPKDKNKKDDDLKDNETVVEKKENNTVDDYINEKSIWDKTAKEANPDIFVFDANLDKYYYYDNVKIEVGKLYSLNQFENKFSSHDLYSASFNFKTYENELGSYNTDAPFGNISFTDRILKIKDGEKYYGYFFIGGQIQNPVYPEKIKYVMEHVSYKEGTFGIGSKYSDVIKILPDLENYKGDPYSYSSWRYYVLEIPITVTNSKGEKMDTTVNYKFSFYDKEGLDEPILNYVEVYNSKAINFLLDDIAAF